MFAFVVFVLVFWLFQY